MNAHVSFNTLAFAKKLQAAGMADQQAEALAEALNDAIFDVVATKADIREVRADLRELELRLTNALTLRLGGMIVAATAIVAALIGIMPILR